MNTARMVLSAAVGAGFALTSLATDYLWTKTDATTYNWDEANAWKNPSGEIVEPPSGSDASVFFTNTVFGTRTDAAGSGVKYAVQCVKTPYVSDFALGTVAGEYTRELQVRKQPQGQGLWRVTVGDALAFDGILLSAGLDWTLAFSGVNAMPGIGGVEARLRPTVDVPAGTTATVGALVGAGGSLTKSGSGTLKVGGAFNGGGTRLTVAGGILELGSEYKPAGDPILWLDASKTNRMELTAGANGRRMVNKWYDVREDHNTIVAGLMKGIAAPFLGGEKLNGIPVVDFGGFCDGSADFSAADAGGLVYNLGQKVKDIVLVYTDTDSPDKANMRSFPVGQKDAYHFHRGQYGRIAYLGTHTNVHLGVLYLDGVKRTCDVVPAYGRFHALEYVLANEGLKPETLAIDRSDCRKGGIRVAEALFYAERLTQEERAQTMRYLARKWNDVKFLDGTDASVLETASDSVKVAVAEGSEASVRQVVVGGTKLVKTGTGTLRVGRFQPESPTIEVEGGAVGFDPTATAVSDLEPAANPFFWGDARRDDFTVVGDNITEWKDRRGAGVSTKGVVQQGAPTLVNNACNGQRVLDFGESGENPAIVKVGSEEYKICEGFQLVRIVRQNNKGNGYYPSVFGDKNYGFVRYTASSLVHPTLATGSPSAGIWTMNGETVDPWNAFAINTNEYYVASFSSAAGMSANWLGVDRGEPALSGDVQLGEVILYDRVLSDVERRQTIAYLMREWKGETYAFARAPAKIGKIQFTAGNDDPRLDAETVTAVGEVVGATKVVKTGGAKLTVESAGEPTLGSVSVEGGTLELADGFKPAVLASAFLQLDASQKSSFTWRDGQETDGRIDRWYDCRGNGKFAQTPFYAAGTTSGDGSWRGGMTNAQYCVSDGTLELPAGKSYVDFGIHQNSMDNKGSSGMYLFDAAGTRMKTPIREMHAVFRILGKNCTPLGGDSSPAAQYLVPSGKAWGGYNASCAAAAAPKVSDGSAWYTANSFSANGEEDVSDRFCVVSIAFTQDTSAWNICMDRNCGVGGLKLCEMILFEGSTNDTATATEINKYLLKKWKGLGTGGDFGKTLSVALSNGGTFKLGAGASRTRITSVSGDGTLDAGDVTGLDTVTAKVAADGTVSCFAVNGSVSFADQVSLTIDSAFVGKLAAGTYPILTASSFAAVPDSFDVTYAGTWSNRRSYAVKAVGNRLCLVVRNLGLSVIVR